MVNVGSSIHKKMSSRLTRETSVKKNRSVSEKRPSIVRPEIIQGLQQFYRLLSPILDQPIKEAIMSEVIWTEEEMCNRMKDFEKGSGSPFWEVLVSTIRSSIAGQFIEEFNQGLPTCQIYRELLLDAVKSNLMNAENSEAYETMNNIVDDMLHFVTKIIREEGDKPIYFKTFLGYLNKLRLSDLKVGCFDEHLSQLNSLRVLVLSGNVIEELLFDCLPASLRILELNNNLISEIKIAHKIKPQLVYLGLSSNCFSDESVIEGLQFLDKLCVLDLGDNNFSSFNKVKEIIEKCPYLECICLKENPLSTVASYKEIIRISCPKLHKLDGVPLINEGEKETPTKKLGNKEQHRKTTPKKEKDKKVGGSPLQWSSICYNAELRIYVFRMAGVPRPNYKTKKLRGYFQFEVQLPLLDHRNTVQKKCNAMFELLRQCGLIPNASDSLDLLDVADEPEKKSHQKWPKVEPRSRSRRNTDRMRKRESWEFEYEEFLTNDQPSPDTYSILSEKMRWGPIMKPNGPIATMPVYTANLDQLRYTLKSIIVIRLYFNDEGPKDEFDTGKRLIAKISVPAREPHWKDDYCSYEWNARHPQIAEYHPPAGSTKYPIGAKGKQRSKSSLGWTVPTCQLGIGLHRIG